ncbi:LOW QUALITY PROTEIN: chondroitin sulfate proteoglycan 5 [Corvus cornix cornix]|uniref:LOW QUALITY PROTEIN: chondroitin sulfate proteoglycan 5 n=1 Tax=Corvus cornix cornix TaxID=932674 RepID=UPI00195285C8|nr:LOW QUALITY PROTEIN: chondroitin sulfate proteoglycan 5 [Corvus cornix cornix]
MAPAPPRPRALALLLAIGALASAWPPQNSSVGEGRAWEGSLESSPPKWDLASGEPPWGTQQQHQRRGGRGRTQLEPPGAGTATTEPSAMPEGCPGCAGEGEASAVPPRAVTWPGDGGTVPVALGSPEEPGSGDRPTPASPPGAGSFGGLPAAPPSPPGPQLATRLCRIRPPAGGRGLGGAADPRAGRAQPRARRRGDSRGPPELWAAASSPAPAQGARGWTDLTWLQEPITAATGPAKPPADRTGSEIIDVDYYDLFEGGEGLGGFPGGGRGAGSARRREPEGAATPWALHELYDDFTPFDDADFYPTTSFYADGDDEDELEDEEEEEEEEDGGLEDENGYWPSTSAAPGAAPAPQDPRPTGHRAAAPPPPPGVSGGSPTAWPRPGERGPPENGSECRSGYVRHNSSCRSLCDLVPSYCHNGGQCYLVESHGAFCRCNTQDYTWHKGTRCESIVTDFQVMCVAVGSAALVVLLLFMLTVFFAKKLYLLKTENSKLRKTKYRTPSELHNDNFSLSTIAEGSHPNDDPGAPHKLQDSLKSCLKDEEPFNIHNSTSPKHDGGKGEQDVGELNCLQNNLT